MIHEVTCIFNLQFLEKSRKCGTYFMDNFDPHLAKISRLLKSEKENFYLALRTIKQVKKRTAKVREEVRKKLQTMGVHLLEEGALDCLLHDVTEFTRFTNSTNNLSLQENWKDRLACIGTDDREIIRRDIAALVRSTVADMFQNPAWLAIPVDGEESFVPPAHAPAPSAATAGTQPAAEDLSASVS